MNSETNWSYLAALRFGLAMIVAGSHTIWFRDDVISLSFNYLDAKSAVVGFLLVSGYSIAASLDRDVKHFYFRRFKRIYLLYFSAVVVGIVLEIWLGRFALPKYTVEPLGILSAIGNLFFLQTFLVKPLHFNGVVWSLAVEVSFYLAAPFFLKVHKSSLVVLILISAAFFVLPHHYNGGRFYPYILKMNAVKYFWPFGIGFLLYYHRSRLTDLAFCILGVILVSISDNILYPLAVLTFCASYLVVLASRQGVGTNSRIMDYLGDISYPLYLVQIPTYILLYRCFGTTSPAVLIGAALLVSIAAYELIDIRLRQLIYATPTKSAKPLYSSYGAELGSTPETRP